MFVWQFLESDCHLYSLLDYWRKITFHWRIYREIYVPHIVWWFSGGKKLAIQGTVNFIQIHARNSCHEFWKSKFLLYKTRRVRPLWYQTLPWLPPPLCQKKKKKKTWHLTRDTCHLTHDTWQVTCDTGHMTHGGRWIFSQNFSSPALTVWDWQFLEDSERKDHSNHESMNHTPGLLNMFGLYHESKNFQITKPISYQLLILKLNISKRPEGDKVWLEELRVVQSEIERRKKSWSPSLFETVSIYFITLILLNISENNCNRKKEMKKIC